MVTKSYLPKHPGGSLRRVTYSAAFIGFVICTQTCSIGRWQRRRRRWWRPRRRTATSAGDFVRRRTRRREECACQRTPRPSGPTSWWPRYWMADGRSWKLTRWEPYKCRFELCVCVCMSFSYQKIQLARYSCYWHFARVFCVRSCS